MNHAWKRLFHRTIALFLSAFFVAPTAAQVINGQTAFDNLQLAGGRAPGTLVSDGIARTQARIILPFGGLEFTAADITATEPPQSRMDVVVDTLVDALFIALADQLSQLLTDLLSALFAGELAFSDLSSGETNGGTETSTSDDSTTPDDSTTDDGSTDNSDGGRGGVRKQQAG